MRTLAITAVAVFLCNWTLYGATATAGQLLISEFRLRGPGGAQDEYVVIYNPTNADHTVLAAAGTGYGLAASDGAVRFSIPNGTLIPAHGHFLGVNSVAYSLTGMAAGDATFTTDIPDNAGIALFNNNAGGANFSIANRLDAVGSTSEANALYKEGAGYAALTPFSIGYAIYRTYLHGTPGDPTDLTDGVPRDTDDNVADFVFVDTNGTNAGFGQLLGAPGPANLASPIARYPLTPNFGQEGIDPSAAPGAAPNKVRDFATDPANNSSQGTLSFRRRFINRTGGNLTELRFRIIKFSTFPAQGNAADLRARTSSSVTVASITGTQQVNGTFLFQPPSQPNGGGWNSILSAGTVTPATPLANGSYINLQFLFGIQQTGAYSFAILVEALPSASHFWFVSGNSEDDSDTEGSSLAQDEYVVTTATDENDIGATPNNPGGTGLSLREALSLANADRNLSTITFATPLFNSPQTITLNTGQLSITRETKIIGPGADKLTISGNSQDRVFSVAAFADTVSISGMTIRDGRPMGGTLGGGGIVVNNSVYGGFVRLSGLTITNNDASMAANAVGGGIANEGGYVLIENCAIFNNTASSRGGGIQNENDGGMTIINSTITENTTGTNGIGGGIRSFLPLTLKSCTIFGNSAKTGGNVSRAADTFAFGNTIIAGGVLIGAGGSGPDLDGTSFSSLNHNLIQDTSGATIGGSTANNMTGVSPLLDSLRNNGGPTPTMALLGGSPARDKGSSMGLHSDQRGAPRPVNLPNIPNAVGGDGSDIGAFEVAGEAASLAISAGDNQSAPVDTAVLIAPSVLVKDMFGTPVAGASVTFQVAAGGGMVMGSPAISDIAGIAALGNWKLGSASGPNMLTVTCGGAQPVTFSATGFFIPPMFQSTPFAAPDPVTVGQPVTLTTAATSPSNAPLTYTWDFGDGSNGAGAAVMHVYTLTGTYTATVTVSDGMTPITATVAIHVTPATALVGAGPDNDGDGFSDTFEMVLATNPNDSTQSPVGHPITAADVKPLALKKAGIKLNFKTAGKDSITLSGTVDIPAGFNPAGAGVAFDAGGVVKFLVLNAKSTAKNINDVVKLQVKMKKGVVASQASKFSATFKNGTFAGTLAGSGFTDANAKKVSVTCVFSIVFNGGVLQRAQGMSYSAKKGKSGSAT